MTLTEQLGRLKAGSQHCRNEKYQATTRIKTETTDNKEPRPSSKNARTTRSHGQTVYGSAGDKPPYSTRTPQPCSPHKAPKYCPWHKRWFFNWGITREVAKTIGTKTSPTRKDLHPRKDQAPRRNAGPHKGGTMKTKSGQVHSPCGARKHIY